MVGNSTAFLVGYCFIVFTVTCYLFIILCTSFLANLTFMKEMTFIVSIGLKLIYKVVSSWGIYSFQFLLYKISCCILTDQNRVLQNGVARPDVMGF